MFYLIKTELKKRWLLRLALIFWVFMWIFMVLPAGASVVAHKRSLKKMTFKKNRVDPHLLENRIQELKKDEDKLTQEQLKIVQTLDKVNHHINQRRLRVALVSQEITELTRKIKQVEQEQQAVLKTMGQNRTRVNGRLCALNRIKETGYWHLFSKPRSLFDFWKRQQALTLILGSDMALLERQSANLKELKRITHLLEGETAEKKLLDSHLNLEIENLEKEKERRQTLLAEVKGKKALTRAAMLSARQALTKTLQTLATDASALDEKKKKETRTVIWKGEKGLFLSRRGSLPMPVTGRIISKFGTHADEDDKTFTFQSGIDIKADMGEPVKSVFRGKILFADWLKGYGNLMIINHGDNYYTLYAHVEEMFKKKGDVVADQEVIATAGETGASRGAYLHFEVRHHGKPVDPLKWLKKGA